MNLPELVAALPATLPELTRLGETGVDLSPALPEIVRAYRSAGKERRAAAGELLLRMVRRNWAPVDLRPFVADFAEFLCSYESEGAWPFLEALDRVAKEHPQLVADELRRRRPAFPGRCWKRLVERMRRRDAALVKDLDRPLVTVRPRHKRPASWKTVVSELPRSAAPILIAVGQYSPDPQSAQRVALFESSQCVCDRWIRSADLPALREHLAKGRTVRTGEMDAMYATAWHCAWTTDGGPFELWDREGLLAYQQGDTVLLRSGERAAMGDIAYVHAFLGEAWIERGVRLVLKDGRALTVARQEDPISLIDPTYDAINIQCEAAWTVSIARSLARILGVPVEEDDPL